MEGIQQTFPSFSDIPYNKRWEPLKPFLEQMYLHEKHHLKDLVKLMETRHRFYASENQYKRQFGIWKWKRSVPNPKKEAVYKMMHTRAQQGKSSVPIYKGQEMDKAKLRRYLKTKSRRDITLGPFLAASHADIELLSGHALQCGNRVFMNWNLPEIIPRPVATRPHNTFSPFECAATPASDVAVETPRSEHSPGTATSPTAVIVQNAGKVDRAHLFVQGLHMELMRGMNRQEKSVMKTWMNQFWLFSFITAKNWNKGPQRRTASMLGFDNLPKQQIAGQLASPSTNMHTLRSSSNEQCAASEDSNFRCEIPTQLCRWSIHINEVEYDRVPSPPPVVTVEDNDPDNEETWQPWEHQKSSKEYARVLEACLETNDFSTIRVRDLPISSSQITRAAKRSPAELRREAFGFAIMARNYDIIEDMMEDQANHEFESQGSSIYRGMFPFHLAASYLDGSKTCCSILDKLVEFLLIGDTSLRKIYVNHLGHTVLDNLMISILKAHTSCSPGLVDDAFKKEQRFAGEDVDICGRWDADSTCIRDLYAHGQCAIPISWKHMFCHTSVQVICHSIGTIFMPHWAPYIDTPSGLFIKRCAVENCGRKLQLLPLHTLVVTTVHLATQGTKGETLFGMLACLLCLLSNGANPTLKAPVSLKALFSDDENNQECDHQDVDPVSLVEMVPTELISTWTHDVKVGWRLFCHVLQLSKAEWQLETRPRRFSDPLDISEFIHIEDDIDDYMDINDTDSEELESDNEFPPICKDGQHEENFFGWNRNLSALWAAVQTEYTTYRRLEEGDPWISEHFSMEEALQSLTWGREPRLNIGLIERGLMSKKYCGCGNFFEAIDEICVRGEEISAFHFSNLEDWHRTAFIVS